MTKLKLVALTFICFLSCHTESPTQFSEVALEEQLVAYTGETVNLESILEKHKGKTILFTFWATWCRDCIEELPRIKKVQQENNGVVYVFLSLDKSIENWVSGISKLDIKGDHYFIPSGWDGPLIDFIDLDWITRYMVVGPTGQIKVFKAIKVNNNQIRENLIN
ncbi:TlpA family protein disulfide reductase [Flavobacteriaceae bacterium LMO-SS05]